MSQEYKSLEQSWMVLKDQYSELARALGFEAVSLWGDPLDPHEKIVERARELADKAWKYDDLSS